jgi:TonB family protein
VNTRRQIILSLMVLSWVLASSHPSFGQTEQAESKRKLVNRVMPSYPDIARNLRIKGVVRIEAMVAPNGSVKNTHVLGGHPLLAQSADDAVHKWRWESAPAETKEFVEVRFDPDNR